MTELITALLIWMGAPDVAPPDVFTLNRLQIETYAGTEYDSRPRDVVAAYTCAFNSLWLRDDFDPRDVWSRAALVHQLEHHRQCLGGQFRRTPTAGLEAEAFQVQVRYLSAQGIHVDIWFLRKMTPHAR